MAGFLTLCGTAWADDWADCHAGRLHPGGLIYASGIFPDPVEYFVGSFLGILSWVAVWNPADIYLSQWLPYRRERLLYECIRTAELILEKVG